MGKPVFCTASQARRHRPFVATLALLAGLGVYAQPPVRAEPGATTARAAASKQAAASSAKPDAPPVRRFVVDDVWAGSSAAYDAISDGPIAYVGYYNRDRYLTVARVDTRNGSVERKRLDSRFRGWDAHNYVTMALDRDGLLHVAGNMHGDALVYGRTEAGGGLGSLKLFDRMVGADETRMTYPAFLKLPDGSLGFNYRSGESANGVELINRFDGKRWSRLTSQPLFAANAGEKPVNAYHTPFANGPDGRVHLAWTWRARPAAEANFDVGYARSRDYVHWETSAGKPLVLPISPGSAEVADRLPEGSGLANTLKLGFDAKGDPVISYIRFDAAGFTQLYHARPAAGGGWQVVAATDWRYRWDFRGEGSVPVEIAFTGVRMEGGQLVEDVRHAKYGNRRLVLNSASLRVNATPAAVASAPSAVRAPAARAPAPRLGSADPVAPPYQRLERPLRRQRGTLEGLIQWRGLGADNRDQARTCESSGLPKGCSMTAPLELFVR